MTPELLCETCGLESPYWIFPSCKKCTGAYIAVYPEAWASNREFYEGVPERDVLEREVARQRDALATINLRVRQAG